MSTNKRAVQWALRIPVEAMLLSLLQLLVLPLAVSLSSSFYSLSGRDITINITVGVNGTYLSALSLSYLNETYCFGHASSTRNLLLPWNDKDALQASRTGLSDDTGVWHGARGGVVTSVTATSLTIENIALNGIANETWRLSVDTSNSFEWSVDRTFLAASTAVTADRAPSLCVAAPLETSSQPQPGDCGGNLARDICVQNQLWAFFDGSLEVNATADAGFSLPTSAQAASATWAEAVSPKRTQTLRLSPSGLALDVRITTQSADGAPFSWSKDAQDLVGASTCFSVSNIDRRTGLPTVAIHGDVWKSSLSMRLRADDGAAPLKLSLGPAYADITAAAQRFAMSHGLANGWVFANSPTSVTCLHELSVFPLMLSILGKPPADDRGTWVDAFESQLRYFAPKVNDSGFIYGRWDLVGVEQHKPDDATSLFGCITDQIPHYILAAYEFAVVSGRSDTIIELLPTLRSLGTYLLDTLGMRENGVATIKCTQGLSRTQDPDSRPSNWWDTLPFGHLDAHLNAYAVRALWSLSELEFWAGNASAGEEYAVLHDASLKAYNRMFWRQKSNSSGGHWVDWIDVQGVAREYNFVWHNAIAAGYARIANTSQAAAYAVLSTAAVAETCERFNVSQDTFFASPSNLFPANFEDLLYCNSARPKDDVYPFYENGDQFLVAAGYEYIAAARNGDADGVLSRLRLAMLEYDRTSFFGQNRDWLANGGQGQMQGGDICTDQLLLLWGGLRGVFGVEPTLRQGLVATNAPAAGLEGAWHAFLYLGVEVNITIKGGAWHVSSS